MKRERSVRQVVARVRRASDQTWRTPPWLRALVHEFYGGPPDCDPCAPADNPLGALVHYTGPAPAALPHVGPLFGAAPMSPPGEDGLSMPWEGRVWMNPPFSDPRWLWKLRDELAAERTTCAVVLLPTNRYETAAYQWALDMATLATWLVDPHANGSETGGRIRFEKPDGSLGGQAPYASQLLGFGRTDRRAWRQVFGRHGTTRNLS